MHGPSNRRHRRQIDDGSTRTLRDVVHPRTPGHYTLLRGGGRSRAIPSAGGDRQCARCFRIRSRHECHPGWGCVFVRHTELALGIAAGTAKPIETHVRRERSCASRAHPSHVIAAARAPGASCEKEWPRPRWRSNRHSRIWRRVPDPSKLHGETQLSTGWTQRRDKGCSVPIHILCRRNFTERPRKSITFTSATAPRWARRGGKAPDTVHRERSVTLKMEPAAG